MEASTKGRKGHLWSIGATPEEIYQKRPLDKNGSSSEEPISKRTKAQCISEEKKALLADYEHQMHEDKCSIFQMWLVGNALAWTISQDMLFG